MQPAPSRDLAPHDFPSVPEKAGRDHRGAVVESPRTKGPHGGVGRYGPRQVRGVGAEGVQVFGAARAGGGVFDEVLQVREQVARRGLEPCIVTSTASEKFSISETGGAGAAIPPGLRSVIA